MPQVHQVLLGSPVLLVSLLQVPLDQQGTEDVQVHLVTWVQEDYQEEKGHVFLGLKEIVVALASLETEAPLAHLALLVSQCLG